MQPGASATGRPSGSLLAATLRPAQRPVLAGANEGNDLHHGLVARELARRLLEPLGEMTGVEEEPLIGTPDRLDALARELSPLEADEIEAFEARVVAVGEPERDDVAAHAADAADHRERSDAGKLMHRREPADHDAVADLDVAAERRAVG